MKLVRFGALGDEKPGAIDENGEIRDLSSYVSDIDGQSLTSARLDELKQIDLSSLPTVDSGVRLGACVATPGKFIGIGLNYRDHAIESGAPIPEEPVVFFKADTSVSGPYDNVIMPLDGSKLDWEVEIAIIIGDVARNVDLAGTSSHIAGYCVVNDVSERAFQIDRGGSQWGKGKGCDTFGPMGPWMVTADEIEDVQNLDM